MRLGGVVRWLALVLVLTACATPTRLLEREPYPHRVGTPLLEAYQPYEMMEWW